MTSFCSITDITELLLHIADYLETRDVACCMATCKVLARNFEPLLWQDVTVKEKLPPENAMLQYRHLIRSLSIQSTVSGEQCLKILTQDIPDPLHLDTSLTDTTQESLILELQKVEMRLPTIHETVTITPNFIKMVHQSYRSLTSLTMTTAMFDDEGNLRDLVEARIWDKLHNLEELTILPGATSLNVLGQVIQLLTGCFRHPRLTKIHFLFSLITLDIEDNKEMKAWTEAARVRIQSTGEPSRIKDLRLPRLETIHSGYHESFFVPLLKVLGPGLERMTAPQLLWDWYDALIETVRDHCPNLRHLATAMYTNQPREFHDVTTMIQACRRAGLESFHLNSVVHPKSCSAKQVELFDELIAHHAATLQVVENEQGKWRPESQLHLMEKCPNLRRLWFDPNILVSDDAQYFSIPAVVHEWVCLHLKELVLLYTLRPNQASYTDALYEQLGRLVHLEVLAIGRLPNKPKKFKDMTLGDGYLGKLAGLSKMRHLHVSSGLWDNLGLEEVTFIKENWPRLQRVSFGCTEKEFNKIRIQYHWRRLCEEQPWIRLNHGYQA